MRTGVIKIVSWCLLVVFLAGVAPKEYLHTLFYHHSDTVHHEYKKGELSLGNKHTHCSFLGFVLAPFVASDPIYIPFRQVKFIGHYTLPIYKLDCQVYQRLQLLRGPPNTSLCCFSRA